MKKLLSLMLLCMVCMGAWSDVTYPANHTPFTMSNPTVTGCDGRGYLVVYNDALYLTDMKSDYSKYAFSGYPTTHTDANANDAWAMYTSPATGNHYLYNVSSGKFLGVGKKLGGTNAAATLDADAKAVTFTDASYSGVTYVSVRTAESLPAGLSTNNNVLNFAPYWGHDKKSDGGTYGCWDTEKNTNNSETRVKIETVSDGTVSEAIRNQVETAVANAEAAIISGLQTKIDAANAAILAKKIGYPNVDDAANTSALDNMRDYATFIPGMSPINVSNYADALAKYQAVCNLTVVNLPKDGKAYYFVNVASGTGAMDGTQRYIKYDESNANLSAEVYTEGSTVIPESSIFICKDRGEGVSGGRFVFVNNKGHYLRYYGQSSNNSRKGALSETFSEADATVNIVKMVKTGDYMAQANSTADLFGMCAITGKRADKTHYNAGIIVSSSGTYDGVDTPYFVQNGYSTAFRIIEVENPNKVKLSNPNPDGTSGLNGKYVGTFSAPYAVELPANVKAYKAEINDAKTVVTFNEIEGTVVPKNTGVLLYAESGEPESATNAIPAATATLPTVSNNIFEPMVNGDITAGNLVIGYTADEGVLFYPLKNAKTVRNKAYISSTNNVSSFRFDFEEQTTGISATQATIENGVAFDLAGRRINANTKGISIMNGQKVIR